MSKLWGLFILLVICLLAFVGLRLSASKLFGYWATNEGGFYKVGPADGGSARVVSVQSSGAAPSSARLSGLRGLRLASGEKGEVDLSARTIQFDNGVTWIRQGL